MQPDDNHRQLLRDIQQRPIGNWSDFAGAARGINQLYQEEAERARRAQRIADGERLADRAALSERAHLGSMVAVQEARSGDFGALQKLGQRLDEALLLGIIPAQFLRTARAMTEPSPKVVPLFPDRMPKLQGAVNADRLPELLGAIAQFEQDAAASKLFPRYTRRLLLPATVTLLNLTEHRLGAPLTPDARATLTQACTQAALP